MSTATSAIPAATSSAPPPGAGRCLGVGGPLDVRTGRRGGSGLHGRALGQGRARRERPGRCGHERGREHGLGVEADVARHGPGRREHLVGVRAGRRVVGGHREQQ